MAGKNGSIKLTAPAGDEFDAYLAVPAEGKKAGVVLMAAVAGVDIDIRNYADLLAREGYPVIAPDPFWRTDPGPSDFTDEGRRRSAARSHPRVRLIEQGVADLQAAIDRVKAEESCNGRVAVAGFCYGGPYAIIGATRLGCDAGISYHGTSMNFWADELELAEVPVQIHWGDADFAAPPPVIDAYTDIAHRKPNVALSIYPGVKHGYMAAENVASFDQPSYDASLADTLGLLNGLS